MSALYPTSIHKVKRYIGLSLNPVQADINLHRIQNATVTLAPSKYTVDNLIKPLVTTMVFLSDYQTPVVVIIPEPTSSYQE